MVTDSLYAVVMDFERNIWVASQYGFSKYENDTWTNFNADNSDFVGGPVIDIQTDESGWEWLAMGNKIQAYNWIFDIWKEYDHSTHSNFPTSNLINLK